MTRKRRSRGVRVRCETSDLYSSPKPCRIHAHLSSDRTVPNPCFLSPQEVYVRMRTLYLYYRPLHAISPRLSNARQDDSARYPESPGTGHLFSRSKLCPLLAYQYNKKTLIHLLVTGLTTS